MYVYVFSYLALTFSELLHSTSSSFSLQIEVLHFFFNKVTQGYFMEKWDFRAQSSRNTPR